MWSQSLETLNPYEAIHNTSTTESQLCNSQHTGVKRIIDIRLSCFYPEMQMVIWVPENRDAEEYIDELLDSMLCEEFRYNAEWDFAN